MDQQLRQRLTARLADGRVVGYPDPDACWEWTLFRDRNGYGQWKVRALGTQRAHRIAWMLLRGDIPEGMVLDHQCRNRACINPAHLRVVTPSVNSTENNVSPWALNGLKTECPRGHLLEGENVEVYQGRRRCVTCARQSVRDYQARRKASGRTMKPETAPRPWCRKGLHQLLDDDGNVLPALWVRPDGRRECRECRKIARKASGH